MVETSCNLRYFSQDESEYWVPGEAARLGLEFLSAKVPHASPKVIMDFLRSMNKVKPPL
jgi:hypothetical protein